MDEEITCVICQKSLDNGKDVVTLRKKGSQEINRASRERNDLMQNLETHHGNNRRKIDHLFKVLRKCKSKFDCLVYEMLYQTVYVTLLYIFNIIVIFLFVFLIPIGPASILCIFSNVIYSLHTLYFFTFELDNGVT